MSFWQFAPQIFQKQRLLQDFTSAPAHPFFSHQRDIYQEGIEFQLRSAKFSCKIHSTQQFEIQNHVGKALMHCSIKRYPVHSVSNVCILLQINRQSVLMDSFENNLQMLTKLLPQFGRYQKVNDVSVSGIQSSIVHTKNIAEMLLQRNIGKMSRFQITKVKPACVRAAVFGMFASAIGM